MESASFRRKCLCVLRRRKEDPPPTDVANVVDVDLVVVQVDLVDVVVRVVVLGFRIGRAWGRVVAVEEDDGGDGDGWVFLWFSALLWVVVRRLAVLLDARAKAASCCFRCPSSDKTAYASEILRNAASASALLMGEAEEDDTARPSRALCSVLPALREASSGVSCPATSG